MYRKIYSIGAKKLTGKENTHQMWVWTDEKDDPEKFIYYNESYIECSSNEAKYKGFNGESLRKTLDWDKKTPKLHFSDIVAHQKYLIQKYGDNDKPSTKCREVFFDIECEMGGALTEDYIRKAPKPITSIAWYDKEVDQWAIVILDKKGQLKHTKSKNKEIIPFKHEADLLDTFLSKMEDIKPDMLIGYNSDYFDIPYLYWRICKVLGEQEAKRLSPIEQIRRKIATIDNNFHIKNMYVDIGGIESMDYMRLHKKYSWEDEPSWKLDAIGEKYVGINKIEYEGSLDRLFEEDIHKFIQYNFVDVEILVELDKKLQYLDLTRNLAHKGKIRYQEVYASSKIHDGALSSYLWKNKIIPPNRPSGVAKRNYAGGFLFCPKAGLYKYMFDEDLTSLYPSIIMSLNAGRETVVGRIVDENLPNNLAESYPYQNEISRNNYLGLNDLKKRDPNEILKFEYLTPDSLVSFPLKDANGQQKIDENRRPLWDSDIIKKEQVSVGRLIKTIEKKNWSVAANGTLFRTDKKSLISIVLEEWFKEREIYKNRMKHCYQNGDKDGGAKNHLLQYTMKILLNSLYGATALPSFRYGLPLSVLSEAITLSGWRIIQESALVANRHMNKVLRDEIKLEL